MTNRTISDRFWERVDRSGECWLRAEIAREAAAIHEAACRYRRQGVRCSACAETQERAARLAKLAGEATS